MGLLEVYQEAACEKPFKHGGHGGQEGRPRTGSNGHKSQLKMRFSVLLFLRALRVTRVFSQKLSISGKHSAARLRCVTSADADSSVSSGLTSTSMAPEFLARSTQSIM